MTEAEQEQDIRDILTQFLDTMTLSAEKAAGVGAALEQLGQAMQDGEPVPIYGAGAVMAYGGPEVEPPPHPRIKQWNQTHGRHPYRGDLLVENLRCIPLADEQIASVLKP